MHKISLQTYNIVHWFLSSKFELHRWARWYNQHTRMMGCIVVLLTPSVGMVRHTIWIYNHNEDIQAIDAKCLWTSVDVVWNEASNSKTSWIPITMEFNSYRWNRFESISLALHSFGQKNLNWLMKNKSQTHYEHGLQCAVFMYVPEIQSRLPLILANARQRDNLAQ